jgi:hypothetical protein
MINVVNVWKKYLKKTYAETDGSAIEKVQDFIHL